jgi:hypothetical protein
MELIKVTTPVWVSQISIDDLGCVTSAYPVTRWMIGRKWEAVERVLKVRYPGQLEIERLTGPETGSSAGSAGST